LTILVALYEWLIASTYVTALTSTRIYCEKAPKDPTFPYVVLGIDTSTPTNHLGGESGHENTIVSIECYARDPKGALEAGRVAEVIRQRISGYRGLWGDVFVQECTREAGPFITSDPPRDGSDNWTFRMVTTYSTHFNQSIPSFV
jgi:hypothetical protein